MTTATIQALHVGQVLQGSWGYDMTINEFYVIQRLTASSVWLREVAAFVSNDNGMGNGRAIHFHSLPWHESPAKARLDFQLRTAAALGRLRGGPISHPWPIGDQPFRVRLLS
jgi:hypothetical protein